ncbi:MAG: hypothetical protein QXV97_07500 [Candidatus Caldarchaeum sp.]
MAGEGLAGAWPWDGPLGLAGAGGVQRHGQALGADAPETRLDGSLGPTDVRRETDDEDNIPTTFSTPSTHVSRTPMGVFGMLWGGMEPLCSV